MGLRQLKSAATERRTSTVAHSAYKVTRHVPLPSRHCGFRTMTKPARCSWRSTGAQRRSSPMRPSAMSDCDRRSNIRGRTPCPFRLRTSRPPCAVKSARAARASMPPCMTRFLLISGSKVRALVRPPSKPLKYLHKLQGDERLRSHSGRDCGFALPTALHFQPRDPPRRQARPSQACVNSRVCQCVGVSGARRQEGVIGGCRLVNISVARTKSTSRDGSTRCGRGGAPRPGATASPAMAARVRANASTSRITASTGREDHRR